MKFGMNNKRNLFTNHLSKRDKVWLIQKRNKKSLLLLNDVNKIIND